MLTPLLFNKYLFEYYYIPDINLGTQKMNNTQKILGRQAINNSYNKSVNYIVY